MHNYSTDSNEREKILYALAVLAVVAAWLLSRALLAAHLAVPWWFDAPSTMGFYGLFFKVFDNYVWVASVLHRTRIVKVPVITGEWRGYVTSSFDDQKRSRRVSVEIRQTWTRLTVLLSSELSHSFTLTAAIQVHAPEGIVLSYQYQNEPKPGAVQTMVMHIGSARLVLEDERCLTGYYYSGRGRQEYGQLFLQKAPPGTV
jgi:hypothetical protein